MILTEAFREPVPQVAIQMAVLIGSISRFDYPSDWIEVIFECHSIIVKNNCVNDNFQLMPRLNEIVNSMDSMQQHRGLLILQQVVKALASKRLLNDRRVFKVQNFVFFRTLSNFSSTIS